MQRLVLLVIGVASPPKTWLSLCTSKVGGDTLESRWPPEWNLPCGLQNASAVDLYFLLVLIHLLLLWKRVNTIVNSIRWIMGRRWFKLNVFAFGRGPLASYLYVQKKIELTLAPAANGNAPGPVSWWGWASNLLHLWAVCRQRGRNAEGLAGGCAYSPKPNGLQPLSGCVRKSDALIIWVFLTAPMALSSFIGGVWVPQPHWTSPYLL